MNFSQIQKLQEPKIFCLKYYKKPFFLALKCAEEISNWRIIQI